MSPGGQPYALADRDSVTASTEFVSSVTVNSANNAKCVPKLALKLENGNICAIERNNYTNDTSYYANLQYFLSDSPICVETSHLGHINMS